MIDFAISLTSRLRAFGTLLLALCLAGCGGGDGGDRVAVFPVSGTVMMSGNPVANATVTFSPEADQPVAMARTDNAGKFTLTTYDANDGAAAGDYKVMVTKAVGLAPRVTSATTHNANDPTSSVNAGELHSAARQSGNATGDSGALLPAKYSSKGDTDLRATVTEDGENDFEFDLQP